MEAKITRTEPTYIIPVISKRGTVYTSSYIQGLKTLSIDARGDTVYIALEEMRDTGITHTVTISLTREEWNTYKTILNEKGGTL